MTEPFTPIATAALTLLSTATAWLAMRRLRASGANPGVLLGLQLGLGVATAATFAYRWLAVSGTWQPLNAHVDGLLLVALIVASVLAYLTWRPGWVGLVAFASPVLTVVLAWAFCAATWTYRPFALDTLEPLWRGVHLVGVYVGTAAGAIAAASAALYLYARRLLKNKHDLQVLDRVSSLETLERAVQRTATLGFVLLTVGLATGVVIMLESPSQRGIVAAPWWVSPKVWLAVGAWSAFALVMNVRYAASFRGPRAAWTAIAGFALLLGTYGVVTAEPNAPHNNDTELKVATPLTPPPADTKGAH